MEMDTVLIRQCIYKQMGNKTLDSSLFGHSGHQWQETRAGLLICLQDGTPASYHPTSSLSDEDIKCCLLRSLNRRYLVDVLAVLDRAQWNSNVRGKGRAGEQAEYFVLVEKICYRLPDLGPLSYQDGLYVLRQGIKAVSCLSSVFDGFALEEEAIGLNEGGECKYWVNSNYFKNYIETPLSQFDNSSMYPQTEQPKQEQIASSRLERQCCLALRHICSPEQDAFGSGGQGSSHVLKSSKNISKTLQQLVALVEGKMLYTMAKDQSTYYNEIKDKHLGKGKGEGGYCMDAVEKWIQELCENAGVGEGYRIAVPSRPESSAYTHNSPNLNVSSNKVKLARNNSTVQLFQLDRSKKQCSQPSSAKMNNFKIVAQPKTSLKKQMKSIEFSHHKDTRLENRHYESNNPESMVNSHHEPQQLRREHKKESGFSQLTIKTANTNMPSYESRSSIAKKESYLNPKQCSPPNPDSTRMGLRYEGWGVKEIRQSMSSMPGYIL